MEQTVKMLVNNQPEVLSRVVGLLTRHGVYINSFDVTPTDEQGIVLMRITTECDDQKHQLMIKQLNRLIEVIEIQNV